MDHRLLVDEQVARARRLIADSVEHVRSGMGEEAWQTAMPPEKIAVTPVDNPYQYSDFHHGDVHPETPRPAEETAGE